MSFHHLNHRPCLLYLIWSAGDVKEPTHLSQRVGLGVPGVVTLSHGLVLHTGLTSLRLSPLDSVVNFIIVMNMEYYTKKVLRTSALRQQRRFCIKAETHKELKRITRVHSVRTFSLPSTIFGNTRSLYANDLHT